jgi:hypothetical protein
MRAEARLALPPLCEKVRIVLCNKANQWNILNIFYFSFLLRIRSIVRMFYIEHTVQDFCLDKLIKISCFPPAIERLNYRV